MDAADAPEAMDVWDPDRLAERLARLRIEQGEPLPRRAAVAVLLHFGDEAEVLLMRRVERTGDPWSGQISLPGGRHEPGDPDLLTTAIRETHEEVGIDLAGVAVPLGRLTPMQARARGGLMAMDVSPFVFRANERAEPVPGEEAEEAFWFPLQRAAAGGLDHPFSYEGKGGTRRLPSWRFEGRTVWGMTHRILSELIGIADGAAGGAAR